ncbi:MAG: ABC-2 family transporter protein [Oscillospiraceae bacterium]|jgi:ABC-2 type transport system permease protein|nr:ABC-2 family transporter protein [Oscillospiraceae bacterium]
MKQYFSLFRIRFINGLQYRAAAFAGLTTQFAWGFMEILAFSAFYRANPAAFPMEFSQLVSYVWIQQAFLALFMPWGVGGNAVEAIVSGNIVYDLARPMDIYNRWFFETIADRVSRATLRCAPILMVAFILPPSFRMALPSNLWQLSMFLISAVSAMCVVTVYCLLDYMSAFYTMSRYSAIFVILADFLAGGVLPIPFFPAPFRKVVELLPFAAMQNMPLRIYSGNISGTDAVRGIGLQLFWLAVMLIFGKWLMKRSLKRTVTQGG